MGHPLESPYPLSVKTNIYLRYVMQTLEHVYVIQDFLEIIVKIRIVL